MRAFSVSFRALDLRTLDLAAVLADSLAPLGSLAAGRTHWAAVLDDIGIHIHSCYAAHVRRDIEPAERLVQAAVPDVDYPHPQRAEWDGDDLGTWFATPGGVKVAIYAGHYQTDDGESETDATLCMDFGRNSRHLACEILGRMVARVPVYDLLARAAMDAALDPPYALIQSAHDIDGTA